MAIRKKWRIGCTCGHEFYVPYEKMGILRTARFKMNPKIMCTACGSKKTKVIKLQTKPKRE